MFSNRLTLLFGPQISLLFFFFFFLGKKKKYKFIFFLNKKKIVWSSKKEPNNIYLCNCTYFFTIFLFFTSAQIFSSITSFPLLAPLFVVSYNQFDAICHYICNNDNIITSSIMYRWSIVTCNCSFPSISMTLVTVKFCLRTKKLYVVIFSWKM